MLTVVLLVLPLGLETFAVSAALGVARVPPRERVRLVLILSACEAAAPLVGLAMGAELGRAVTGVGDYLAIAILLAFGAYMLRADEDVEEEQIERLARVRGWAAVTLALSVSVDEIAIGFSLGLLEVPLVPVLIAIALQAFVAAQLGLRVERASATASASTRSGSPGSCSSSSPSHCWYWRSSRRPLGRPAQGRGDRAPRPRSQ